jgi:signal transduction histidine kinase
MTIGMKIWLAFMLFTAIVFVLMWLLQIVFLQTFYPVYKINQTKKIASEISAIYSTSATFSEDIQQIAFKNNACIEVLDSQGREKIGVDVLNGNCMLHGNRIDSYIIFDKLTASDSGTFTMKTYDNKIQSDVILYGCVIGSVDSPEGYILLDLPLAPVESFISIIKSQTLYIISILLVIALIISIYISNHIANPLKRITKSAQQLAKGDYTAKFEGGGYYEADKLAETLTFAESEISKVEMMQRDLIANTSHDLKTPLTMLKAYAEMIRDLSGDNPDKRNKHLKIIIDETDRLTALVNDMLDLSKIESGSQKLDITQFDISAKMDTIFSRYSLLSKQSDYHIYFESAQSCIVECDEGKIERVICNLINNAINYTSKEKNIYLREIIQPDGVIIEVEDTGDGIEKDKIKLIFDKYYRSENHKRETMGTGLGLSIVKAILQMHDYGFGVRSQVGKGSVFWFKIKR